MKVKFNKFERVAGIFVLTTIIGGLMMLAGVAIKQGWFERKIPFKTTLINAEGVRAGTAVQMSGLRAGQVTSVELRSNNAVHVVLEVSEKYAELVRSDSVVRAIRPFIISEKVLEITIGDLNLEKAKAHTELGSEATADIMDLVTGRTLGPHLEKIGKMMENLRVVVEALLDPSRSKDIIKIFDNMSPLVQSMTLMAKEAGGLLRDANKDKKLVRMTHNLYDTTEVLNKVMPQLAQIMPELTKLTMELAKIAPELLKESPKLAADLSKIASNMAILTDEIQGTLPYVKETMKELGPEIPRSARRAMEALDETVVTLKALQKSFILSGKAQEVRDEEAEKERKRQPASDAKTTKGK